MAGATSEADFVALEGGWGGGRSASPHRELKKEANETRAKARTKCIKQQKPTNAKANTKAQQQQLTAKNNIDKQSKSARQTRKHNDIKSLNKCQSHTYSQANFLRLYLVTSIETCQNKGSLGISDVQPEEVIMDRGKTIAINPWFL